jgi:hypothetical protein
LSQSFGSPTIPGRFIVIILTVSIITILKINHRPYLTAIIKALIIAIALIILIIISKYTAGENLHQSDFFRIITYVILIFIPIIILWIFLIRIREILKEDLKNP